MDANQTKTRPWAKIICQIIQPSAVVIDPIIHITYYQIYRRAIKQLLYSCTGMRLALFDTTDFHSRDINTDTSLIPATTDASSSPGAKSKSVAKEVLVPLHPYPRRNISFLKLSIKLCKVVHDQYLCWF